MGRGDRPGPTLVGMSQATSCPPEPPATLPETTDFAQTIASALEGRTARTAGHPGRASAVLLALFDRDSAPHLLLTKRSHNLEHHPGQISLPGGRPEADDADLATTALRETHEELAIPPGQIQLLGRLDEMYTMASDFLITPYVGLIDGEFTAVPNASEVAGVLEVAVVDLLSADTLIPPKPGRFEVRYPPGRRRRLGGDRPHSQRFLTHRTMRPRGRSEGLRRDVQRRCAGQVRGAEAAIFALDRNSLQAGQILAECGLAWVVLR